MMTLNSLLSGDRHYVDGVVLISVLYSVVAIDAFVSEHDLGLRMAATGPIVVLFWTIVRYLTASRRSG